MYINENDFLLFNINYSNSFYTFINIKSYEVVKYKSKNTSKFSFFCYKAYT